MDDVEEYLRSVEDYFYSSLLAVTYSLPDVHEVVNQLWVDISRYGPGMPSFPEVHIPTLGEFQVPLPPPPPPPPPMPTSWITRSTHWIGRQPWKASGIVVGVVGAGMLVGYSRLTTRRRHLRTQRVQIGEHRQVVGKIPLFVLLANILKASSCPWWRHTLCASHHSGVGKERLHRHHQRVEQRCC